MNAHRAVREQVDCGLSIAHTHTYRHALHPAQQLATDGQTVLVESRQQQVGACEHRAHSGAAARLATRSLIRSGGFSQQACSGLKVRARVRGRTTFVWRRYSAAAAAAAVVERSV